MFDLTVYDGQVFDGVEPVITFGESTSGSSVTGTSITVTIPANTGRLLLIVSRNQPGTYTFTGATADVAATGGDRVVAWIVTPGGGSTFTVTASSAVWSWWCVAINGAGPTSDGTGGSSSNTTAAVEMPTVTLPEPATGDELVIFAAGTNSTATWTVPPVQVFATTAGNAALAVSTVTPAAGATTVAQAAFDRGSGGSTRNESTLAFTVHPAPATIPSGTGAGATSWVGTATGTTTKTGAGAGAVAWSGQATGSTTRSGVATGAHAWQGAAAGQSERAGTATGHTGWHGTAAGAVDRHGTGTGVTAWAGTATGAPARAHTLAPADRTAAVAADTRRVTVPRDHRTHTIPAETRTVRA